ncbi:TIGR04282 family arsenosugar biosynthesis glycosyltransferase [Pontibacter sp. SGAir0037]|uniref:TIGR04282 family arsenosugar biosynthesis glycosyltransferase n=1 Tax=Pontibacter sp. SGAir0037 TaxID=2571030 RepID=UPI0010CCBC8B|nr:TIGR04282 family arsenosugar biosynthesis glycosyltransferase [Pontibacter sp. SGAir0037]QCR23132.1 glycosyltransferase [Pontibacter sp. SGAir0037]
MSRLLMLFVRNPELGKVKTRLAASIGEKQALDVYIRLLQHTRNITRNLAVDKLVYYAERVEEEDLWEKDIYQKQVQPDGDLGEKMQGAFAAAFKEGYTSVMIIGSDCLQLSQAVIEEAFNQLQTHDVVIGPAEDGGYYLLGMNKLYPYLFQDKRWSTEYVFPDTLQDVHQHNLSCFLLPTLSDIDHAEDLPAGFLL